MSKVLNPALRISKQAMCNNSITRAMADTIAENRNTISGLMPEPSCFVLASAGLFGLGVFRRRLH